jgi:flagellar protein FliS
MNMTTPSKRAISAYVQTGIETGVPDADAHRLVLMLFDGALAAVADARNKLRNGDIAGRGQAISKAIAIVDEGLRASLDSKAGGEIASHLEGLYRYVCSKLLEANLRAQAGPLEEASSLLTQLQSAWAAIAPAQPEAAHA